MDTGRANLRIPRRAQAQWNRVKAKLAEQIEARGQEADGPTIFCEAVAMLDAMTGGMGTIASEEAPFYEVPAATGADEMSGGVPIRPVPPELRAACELRHIADRLDRLAMGRRPKE